MKRTDTTVSPSFLSVRKRRKQDGAAAVEFALVLPVLLIIVFGIIAYGFVFAAQLNMNSAARDASRAGVVQPLVGTPMTCQAIANQAKTASNTIGLTPSKVSVTVSSPSVTPTPTPTCTVPASGSATGSTTATMCTGSATGGQLKVVITYSSVKVPVPLVPIPKNLIATGSFQCEYS
jgi:Flp pilus assembly protein TadG